MTLTTPWRPRKAASVFLSVRVWLAEAGAEVTTVEGRRPARTVAISGLAVEEGDDATRSGTLSI